MSDRLITSEQLHTAGPNTRIGQLSLDAKIKLLRNGIANNRKFKPADRREVLGLIDSIALDLDTAKALRTLMQATNGRPWFDPGTKNKLQGIESCLEFLSDALNKMAEDGLNACDALGASRILSDIAADLCLMLGDEPEVP